MPEAVPMWKKALVISGMLIFGTCTVVIQKTIFNMQAVGARTNSSDPNSATPHKFEKPWFQTEVMFVGMFGCLAVYEIMRLVQFFQKKGTKKEQQPLLAEKPSLNAEEEHKPGMPVWKQYLLAIPPAMCDLFATASMNIGLLWIPASVWQMLRGSMTVFAAIFSKFFLKKPMFLYRWVGVGIVVFALCVVAVSSLMTPCETKYTISSVLFHTPPAGATPSQLQYWMPTADTVSSSDAVTTTEEVTGILLVVFAQVIQASQIVIESHLMEGISLHPILIVGLEGLWGGIACSLCLVIVQFIPPPIGEDTIDSFKMIGNDGQLAGTIVAYATAILCYNMFGMYVTQVSSPVIRTILEALRTACIWVVDLFIHYVITDDPNFGEVWTNWSYLQLVGFLFLLCGMFVYNGIIQIQGLYYPTPEELAIITAKLAGKPPPEPVTPSRPAPTAPDSNQN